MMVIERSNQEWRLALESDGDRQGAAIQDLRAILIRAALYTFQHSLASTGQFDQVDIQQLAEDCAQEATIAILESLSTFRGDAKFTTWAYKFAINIALTTARRERWKGVSLDQLPDQEIPSSWFKQGHLGDPDLAASRSETREILSEVIRTQLTDKQRTVLKWMVFDEVPMDVVVQHLHTNRNAIYKLLHDARRKLKQTLLDRGIGAADALDLFGNKG